MNKDPLQIPVVIPAYEPDGKLSSLIGDLRAAGFLHIVVVNDGSSPSTAPLFQSIAEEYGCVVLHHHVNQGKGRALKTAFSHCLREYPECIGCITADADGQHSPDCIGNIAEAMTETPDSLVLGVRDFNKEDVPAKSEYGNRITRNVMRYFAGISVSDTQTGLRGIPAAFMKDLLSVKGERYEFETNMLLETRRRGVSIREVPIRTIYIDENRSSHFHPVKDSIRVYMMFGKFIFSSLSSSIIDLAVFTLFCFLFRETEVFGGSAFSYISAATVGARVISAVFNYIMNQRVVFESETSFRKTFPRYAALAVIQMCLSALLVSALHSVLNGPELLSKIPVDTCLFLLSYYIQREVVYR